MSSAVKPLVRGLNILLIGVLLLQGSIVPHQPASAQLHLASSVSNDATAFLRQAMADARANAASPASHQRFTTASRVQRATHMRAAAQGTGALALTITAVDTDIVLDWVDNPAAVAYEVHRSATAFFTPNSTTRLATLSGDVNSYTDIGAAGDPAVNYIYKVQALSGGSAVVALSGEVGEMDYALNNAAGSYSLIAIPFTADNIVDAASLAATISNAAALLKWNAPNQTFQFFQPPNSGDNFTLAAGDAVFVQAAGGGPNVVTLVGAVTQVQFDLVPNGFNFISLPLSEANLTDAAAVAADIGSIQALLAWNEDTQLFRFFTPPNSGDNFALSPGTPFIVQTGADSPTVWPPGSQRATAAIIDPAPNANGWNNTDITVTFVLTDTDGQVYTSAPVDVTDEGADQLIEGTVVDGAGATTTVTTTVNIDKTAPTIVPNTAPQPNAAGWHKNNVAVNFAADDALSGIDAVTGSTNLALEGADQVLDGTATDRAGNSTNANTTISLDSTPPNLVITTPTDGSTVNDPQLTVSGTVDDPLSGVAGMTCNSVAATVSNDNFSCDLSLNQGPNLIVAQTTDVAGNMTAASIEVTYSPVDNVPPTIAIEAPTAGAVLFQGRPAIELTFADDDLVDTASRAFTANGTTIEVDCQLMASGGTCTPVAALPDGVVTLAATIADFAGNSASDQVEFTVDTLPLSVDITTPTEGLITNVPEIAVTGAVGGDVTGVVVNGVTASLNGTTFNVTVPLREGTNRLVAIATAANGKTGTASIDVTRDIFAPIVRIDSPRDGFVSADNLIAVTGQVNDIVNGAIDATVFVNGIQAEVSDGAFLALDVPLVNGANTVEAVATDAVGNQGSHTITVTRQPPVGARIRIESGNGQQATINQQLAAPLTVIVEDDAGNPIASRLVTFQVTRNNAGLGVTAPEAPIQNGSGCHRQQWPSVGLPYPG